MTWPAIFFTIAIVSGAFGFGPLASAEVARILSVVFAILGVGSMVLRLMEDRSSR